MEICLNAKIECINKYKNNATSSNITRAYNITKTWHDFHLECKKVKQILINNYYSNKIVDQQINNFFNKNLKIKKILTLKIELRFTIKIKP